MVAGELGHSAQCCARVNKICFKRSYNTSYASLSFLINHNKKIYTPLDHRLHRRHPQLAARPRLNLTTFHYIFHGYFDFSFSVNMDASYVPCTLPGMASKSVPVRTDLLRWSTSTYTPRARVLTPSQAFNLCTPQVPGGSNQ